MRAARPGTGCRADTARSMHRWLLATAHEQGRVILTQDRFFITAQVQI